MNTFQHPAVNAALPTSPEVHGISRDDILARARDLAAELAQGAAVRDRERQNIDAEIRRFAASGLGAIQVPVAEGGAGAGFDLLAEVLILLAEADPSVGQVALVHWSAVDLILARSRPPARARLLGLVLDRQLFGNASAEGPSNIAGHVATRITPVSPGRYRLDGEKFYTTGALYSDWIYVPALLDGARHIVVIDTARAGVTIRDDWTGMGQRGTASGSATFTAVALEEADLFGPWLTGTTADDRLSAMAQLYHSALEVGIGNAALADTIAFLRGPAHPPRGSGATSAREDVLTLRELGALVLARDVASAIVEKSARRLDRLVVSESDQDAADVLHLVSEAKILSERYALQSASALFELAGTASALEERNFSRHWRNSRTHTLHDASRWKYVALGQRLLNGLRPNAFTLAHPFEPLPDHVTAPDLRDPSERT